MKTDDTNIRAILFADIVGSSNLYVEKGNATAQAIIANTLSGMSNVVRMHQGVIVKTIGDEIMTSFPCATTACNAAIAINEFLEDSETDVRIGIAYGDVLLNLDTEGNSDIFGDTVNNAAFLAKLAKARQIIISEDTLNASENTISSQCEKFDNVPLKGKKNPEYVHRISWEKNSSEALDATMMATNTSLVQISTKTRLYLCTPEKTIILNKTDEAIICGRDPSNTNICISSDKTSRKHCSFYFLRGKFVVEDHSTNGTYMHPSENPENPIYIRRETIPLALSGTINLGQPMGDHGPQIRFEIHLNALD